MNFGAQHSTILDVGESDEFFSAHVSSPRSYSYFLHLISSHLLSSPLLSPPILSPCIPPLSSLFLLQENLRLRKQNDSLQWMASRETEVRVQTSAK
eukprot:221037-Hanusia_phi.AAC.1